MGVKGHRDSMKGQPTTKAGTSLNVRVMRLTNENTLKKNKGGP
jgi:hypothetical protein